MHVDPKVWAASGGAALVQLVVGVLNQYVIPENPVNETISGAATVVLTFLFGWLKRP